MTEAKLQQVIAGKRYNTETAAMIANDAFWDGSNHERHGRNTYLYRTPKGNCFATHHTQWQGEADTIEPLTQAAAQEMFEGLRIQEVDFDEAFPNAKADHLRHPGDYHAARRIAARD